MPQPKLLVFDVDGTLLGSDGTMSGATRIALSRAADAGIRLLPATGRRYGRALEAVEGLPLDGAIVSGGGALVKRPHDHHTLRLHAFPDDTLRAVLRLVDELGFQPVLCADTFLQGFEFYVPSTETDCPTLREFLIRNEGSGRVAPDMIAQPPADVFTSYIMGTREVLREAEATLHDRMPGRLYMNVLFSPNCQGFVCEISAAGISKWEAIRWLADRWDIADEDICAVGDDVNDREMIAAAGLGIAMGNAIESVKQSAARIAPGHDEDGLAEVVRWVLQAS